MPDRLFNDERYNSGTSMTRTRKEELLDDIDTLFVGDMTDSLYLSLKKLTVPQLQELRSLIKGETA